VVNTEVWILGGTGRSGRAIAVELVNRGITPVLVGRDGSRLAEAAARAGAGRTVVAGSVDAMADEIRRQQPAVVINTIGPFTTTAPPLTRACLPASHYVDLANDLAAVSAVLDLQAAAVAAGRTVVTGAGFGVTATESVVATLCADRPAPRSVRVDMVPSLEVEAGLVGDALAATILTGLPGVDGGRRYEGRRYENGHLVPARIGGEATQLTLPDGSTVTTASIPLGELLAAQRASAAPSVVAASSEAPAGPLVRPILPVALSLLAIPPVRAFAIRRLAAVRMKARPRPRENSWGHACVEWADGTRRDGWLRVGDAQEFTGAVPAEIARRLLAGEGRAGAFTPAALFGPSLAEACGGEYLIDDEADPAGTGSTSTPKNTAAWLREKNGHLEVGPAPYPRPRAREIVVRNHAVAINPVDWLVPIVGGLIYPWLTYPAVLGSDVAGEVVAVGSAVTRFEVGDRVLGHAVGIEKNRNSAAEGAFQSYSVLLDYMASPIPVVLSYEQAAVLPLGLSTAACGLFQKDLLALRLPVADAAPVGETVLVWGGSTSVGSNAIQLAVAAGYDVITTASPHNFEYVTGLGASQGFDYRSETVVRDIIEALRGRSLAGALAVGVGSAEPCLEIVHATAGGKVLATASTAISFEGIAGRRGRLLRLVPLVATLVRAQATLQLRARRWGIRTKSIWGGTLKDNEVGPAIYVDFLPAALADGRYVAAPEPLVVGSGLDHVQTGFDTQKRGVSARKVVVSL
jgi:NADPH:quinone reductase-like Zn-dependent oxidoreductase/short subunit dehydrogenase-like uncharacterized protein